MSSSSSRGFEYFESGLPLFLFLFLFLFGESAWAGLSPLRQSSINDKLNTNKESSSLHDQPNTSLALYTVPDAPAPSRPSFSRSEARQLKHCSPTRSEGLVVPRPPRHASSGCKGFQGMQGRESHWLERWRRCRRCEGRTRSTHSKVVRVRRKPYTRVNERRRKVTCPLPPRYEQIICQSHDELMMCRNIYF